MKRLKNIYLLLLLTVLVCSCDDLMPVGLSKDNFKENMEVTDVEFSPDYKTFSIKVKLTEGIPYSLSDSSQVKVETKELNELFKESEDDSQPQLTAIKNIRAQELSDMALNVLVLVDLTLPYEAVRKECGALREIQPWFTNNNLYVAFITERGVTESMPVTEYVLGNYFVPSGSKKQLYRSILCKLDEMKGIPSRYFPKVPQDTVWKNMSKEHKSMIVFSDGVTYKNNFPIDPMHYGLEEEIVQSADSLVAPNIYYVNFGEKYADGEGNDIKPIANLLCERTDGMYLDKMNWSALLDDMIYTFGIDYADYQFFFVNPDNKIYRGYHTYMQIEFSHDGKTVASTRATYTIGSVYKPVVVNGESTMQILLHGFLMGALVFILTWVIFQFVIPFVRYRIFKHKYVARYTRKNMIYNGVLVSQSCYLCKAPFDEGDEIVARCAHVMHKSCWDENGYKCPEHGRNCKEGSHYYNSTNLFDRHNAGFYMKWILAGILSGLTGWLCFASCAFRDTGGLITSIILSVYATQPGTAEAASVLQHHGSHLYFLPFYGFCISVFLTFFLSLLSVRHNRVWHYIASILVRTVAAGVCGYLCFLLGCVISIVLDLDDNTLLIDWIPWSLTGFIIAFIVTFRTGIRLRKWLILASVLLGLLAMYMWSYMFFRVPMNVLEQMLFSHLIYAVGMAVSIATVAPRSERYFLRVVGPVKEMDIALYKWLSTSPDYRVTIGKSVNCSLQLSWDLDSDIAPIAAEVIREHGKVFLTATDYGVVVGSRELAVDARVRLYHGKKFSIGRTTFTYVEKDVIQ